MKETALHPKQHFFVCGNTRPDDSPLGRGCGLVGEHVYVALKREVDRARAHRDIWITKTYCLGVCPKHGATVAVYPQGDILAEVEVSDAVELIHDALKR